METRSNTRRGGGGTGLEQGLPCALLRQTEARSLLGSLSGPARLPAGARLETVLTPCDQEGGRQERGGAGGQAEAAR